MAASGASRASARGEMCAEIGSPLPPPPPRGWSKTEFGGSGAWHGTGGFVRKAFARQHLMKTTSVVPHLIDATHVSDSCAILSGQAATPRQITGRAALDAVSTHDRCAGHHSVSFLGPPLLPAKLAKRSGKAEHHGGD